MGQRHQLAQQLLQRRFSPSQGIDLQVQVTHKRTHRRHLHNDQLKLRTAHRLHQMG